MTRRSGTFHTLPVNHVYQAARRDSKAVVLHDDTGRFEGGWPKAGFSYLVPRGADWGPHNANPNVLYLFGVATCRFHGALGSRVLTLQAPVQANPRTAGGWSRRRPYAPPRASWVARQR